MVADNRMENIMATFGHMVIVAFVIRGYEDTTLFVSPIRVTPDTSHSASGSAFSYFIPNSPFSRQSMPGHGIFGGESDFRILPPQIPSAILQTMASISVIHRMGLGEPFQGAITAFAWDAEYILSFHTHAFDSVYSIGNGIETYFHSSNFHSPVQTVGRSVEILRTILMTIAFAVAFARQTFTSPQEMRNNIQAFLNSIPTVRRVESFENKVINLARLIRENGSQFIGWEAFLPLIGSQAASDSSFFARIWGRISPIMWGKFHEGWQAFEFGISQAWVETLIPATADDSWDWSIAMTFVETFSKPVQGTFECPAFQPLINVDEAFNVVNRTPAGEVAISLCHILTTVIRPVFRLYMEIQHSADRCTPGTFGIFDILRGPLHSDPRKFNNPTFNSTTTVGGIIPHDILHEAMRVAGPVCWDCQDIHAAVLQGEDAFRVINRSRIIRAVDQKTRHEIQSANHSA